MTIAVIDDSTDVLSAMKELITEYSSVNNVDLSVELFTSPIPFLEGYKPYRYPLVFLDIFMDEMTGIEAASKLRSLDKGTVIVFLTSSDEFRPEAFRFHAFDYIMKPVERSRVFGMLDDFFHIQHDSDINVFNFYSGKIQYSLPVSDIITIQTSGHYLDILDLNGNSYRTRMSFSEAMNALSSSGCFLQLLRGVSANMDHISGFSDHTCIMSDGKRLPVNIRQSRELETVWKNYKFTKIREAAMGRPSP